MSGQLPPITVPPDPPDPHDETDLRMAQVLSGSSSGADLRRQLQNEGSPQADDLLGRLNALDFVSAVVGGATDIPERLGVYKITGLLGRGGMGTVYSAFQEQLEREVALKVLSPAWSADPTMRQRFRAEAKATAALHHRHIVPIYDYGEAAGMLFFAMERVDGMSLDKHIAAARRLHRPPMEPIEAARRFAGVADALGLAHRRRILHRDVKPGNILVAADGTLALTDFGLAKVLDQVSARLTSKGGGGFLGTLHYSSPEQAAGRELTLASDLYSLGVTLFEALSGELPNAGRTTEAVLQSILYGTPRRLRELLPRPPRDLEAVLEKLLSREPQDRYQDGEMLARDLQRIADGEPVQIRRQPLWVRAWRRARKNPVLAGAVAAAGVLLLVTLTLFNVLRRETKQGLVSRHQIRLTQIANEVRNEMGPVVGPAPLLDCLVGGRSAALPPNEQVLADLQIAAAELPTDQQPEAMRLAYVEDPLPEASRLLQQGRGYEALRLFDASIAAGVTARVGVDLSVDLRLYRLYLGRAVTNLTQSVAQLNHASRDLVLATFLRPGAIFPRALTDVLDVAQSADVPAALERLDGDLAAASAERRRVVARLLLAVAALQPRVDANLMDFALSWGSRRALHDLASAWLFGEPDPGAPREGAAGLAGQLLRAAGQALAHAQEPAVMRNHTARLRVEIDKSVHPDSPLQGWRGALQLLEPSHGATLLDHAGREQSPSQQLEAWRCLLRLGPQPQLLELLLPEFDALRREHPGLPGLSPVAARLHVRALGPEAATLAHAWVLENPEDPEARLCRLQVNLRANRLEPALDDAMAAVQSSVEPARMLEQVALCCDAAAAEATSGSKDSIRALGLSFRSVELRITR